MLIGLASELAGAFYLSTGASVTAQQHMCAAYKSYMVLRVVFKEYIGLLTGTQKWGALAKVRALVQRLPFIDFAVDPHLFTPLRGGLPRASLSSVSDGSPLHAQVDVEAIIKASQMLTTDSRYSIACKYNVGVHSHLPPPQKPLKRVGICHEHRVGKLCSRAVLQQCSRQFLLANARTEALCSYTKGRKPSGLYGLQHEIMQVLMTQCPSSLLIPL